MRFADAIYARAMIWRHADAAATPCYFALMPMPFAAFSLFSIRLML